MTSSDIIRQITNLTNQVDKYGQNRPDLLTEGQRIKNEALDLQEYIELLQKQIKEAEDRLLQLKKQATDAVCQVT